MKKKLFVNILSVIIILTLAGLIGFSIIDQHVNDCAKQYIYPDVQHVPEAYVAIVLGARVYDGRIPSLTLEYRIDKAFELYRAGKVKKFLLSGDHGRKDYDEVNTMKDYLLRKGVKKTDIFLDHAGFSTYDSCIRARKIFLVDDAIIVSQAFHIPRAVYLARKSGIKAFGVPAECVEQYRSSLERREKLSVPVAFLYAKFKKQPKYLGKTIPITGESQKSWDE